MTSQLSLATIRRLFLRHGAALLLIFFPAVMFVQLAAHAWTNDVGAGTPDESAHFITGLMIHDYIAQGLPDTPLAFARNYYLHYPKVAFGVWPPLLHIVEAAWMLAFSSSYVSLLLLVGFINALIAATLFNVTRRHFGAFFGAGAGLVFLLMPEVTTASVTIMADALVALLNLWAILSFAKFVQTRKDRYAYMFAGLASLGALTKANGLALVLLPSLTVVMMHDWGLLKGRTFWITSLSSIVVSLPWNYFLWRFAQTSLERSFADINVVRHALFSVKYLVQELGISMTPLFLAGIWAQVSRAKFARVDPIWAAAAASIASTLILCSVNPGGGMARRYIVTCLPPALLFSAAGLHWIGQKMSSRRHGDPAVATLVGCVALAVFAGFQVRIPQPHRYGYADIARDFANTAEPKVFLTSSSATGEGAAISAIAVRDHPRPKHFVLRASKVLAESGWSGSNYRVLYNTPQDMSAFLIDIPVDYVLYDASRSGYETPHHGILRKVLQSYPDSWELVATYPGDTRTREDGNQVQVYKRKKPSSRNGIHISIDLTRSLAGVLEYTSPRR